MQFTMPVYENILELHDLALQIGGGLQGILHEDRIRATIDRPQTYMDYDDECDIHLVCAIILHSLATGHGFVEGNKRTALLTMLITYNANRVLLKYTHVMNDEYKELTLWVVKEKPHVKEIAPKLEALADKYAAGLLEQALKKLSGGL
jgi:death-on-curing protein